MGKPFVKELARIHDTLDWVNDLDLSDLYKIIDKNSNWPLLIVGSGGSLSACHFAVTLAQGRGQFAKAMTPLELLSAKSIISNSIIIFLSASGKNNDIKFAFKLAIEQEAKQIISITMRENSPLSQLSKKHSISTCFDFNIPTGKDGFLATNSLVSFFGILFRLFVNEDKFSFEDDEYNIEQIDDFINSISSDHSLIVLHSGWSQGVAYDIESKCTEAALINVLLSDYRNFGHGRHHWFDKRGSKSAILAIETELDKELANKTIRLIPESIPKLTLRSTHTTPKAVIDLLIKSFYLINKLGELQGIDPGRPGVPDYGSKLYNLRFSSLVNNQRIKLKDVAIRRKLEAQGSKKSLRDEEVEIWEEYYDSYLKRIHRGKFGSIVFDYDGTICSEKNRYFKGISDDLAKQMILMLKAGFIIGIATGRGKSVRVSLQETIPKEYWDSVIIGYYNGGQVGKLNNESIPNRDLDIYRPLKEVFDSLKNIPNFKELSLEIRPHQLTIETTDTSDWQKIRSQLQEEIVRINKGEIKVLESSHSIDIIPNHVTKINVVDECTKHQENKGLGLDVLCIGDRGKWPGNDYQLLDTVYSLSVDEVSSNPERCWNLSIAGMKNTDSTLYYLNKIIKNGRFMRIKF